MVIAAIRPTPLTDQLEGPHDQLRQSQRPCQALAEGGEGRPIRRPSRAPQTQSDGNTEGSGAIDIGHTRDIVNPGQILLRRIVRGSGTGRQRCTGADVEGIGCDPQTACILRQVAHRGGQGSENPDELHQGNRQFIGKEPIPGWGRGNPPNLAQVVPARRCRERLPCWLQPVRGFLALSIPHCAILSCLDHRDAGGGPPMAKDLYLFFQKIMNLHRLPESAQ